MRGLALTAVMKSAHLTKFLAALQGVVAAEQSISQGANRVSWLVGEEATAGNGRASLSRLNFSVPLSMSELPNSYQRCSIFSVPSANEIYSRRMMAFCPASPSLTYDMV